MSQAAPPSAEVTTSDLSEAVVAAQEELAQGVKRGDLTRDPYRFVLGALSVTVGLFPQLVERMEQAAEATRVPLSAEEKAAFRRDVREGLRTEAAKLATATSRRTALLAAAALVGALAIGGVGGYLLGRSSTREDVAVLGGRLSLDADVTRAWLGLVRANPDPRPAITAGTAYHDPTAQRRAVELRLWTDPAPAVAPPRR